MRILLPIGLLTVFSSSAYGARIECLATAKFSAGHTYTAQELAAERPSVLIDEDTSGVTVSRCGFSKIAKKVTCDAYSIDRVERYERTSFSTGEAEHLKKYYLFKSHYDVQLFPDLSFVENNGRGTITFGICHLAAP